MNKEIDVFSNKVKDVSSSNKVINTSSKKEGNSLFDNMLSDIKKNTNIEIKNKQSTENKVNDNNKNVDVQNLEDKNLKSDSTKKSAKNIDTLDANKNKSEATGITEEKSSILDKMIIESKNTSMAKDPLKLDILADKIEILKNVKTDNLQTLKKEDKNVNIKVNNKLDESLKTVETSSNLDKITVETKDSIGEKYNNIVNKKEVDLVKKEALTEKSIIKVFDKNTNGIKEDKIIEPIKGVLQNSDSVENIVKSNIVEKDSSIKGVDKKVDLHAKVETNQDAIASQKSIFNRIIEKDSINNGIDKKIEINLNKKIVKETETSTSKNSDMTVKNEKVANQLSKLSNNVDNNTVNLHKDQIKEINTNTKKENSLIDKIINENKKNISTDEKVLPEIKNSIQSHKQVVSNDILTNIYLSAQKKSLNNKEIEVKHEGIKTALNASAIKDVEKSAKLLNLGLKDASIDVKAEEKIYYSKSTLLDKLAFVKNTIKNDLDAVINNAAIKKLTANSLDSEIKTVQLSVSQPIVQTIQNRIVGARQQLSGMMSDLAKTMYENYKPPVTAFRIKLDPGTLGSIAILIKSDQKNSLSISLNSSNNMTMDALIDNQSSLRAALSRNFDTATNFSLDFSQGDTKSDSGNNQNSSKKEQDKTLDTKIDADSKDVEMEQSLSNYM